MGSLHENSKVRATTVKRACRTLAVAVLFSLGLAAGARGQEPAPTSEPVREVDLFDLVRLARGRPLAPDNESMTGPMYAFAPVIGSRPSTGPFAGAAGNVAMYLGDPQTTRLSSIVLSLTASTKGQVILSGKHGLFADGNRWYMEGDNRFNWYGLNTYDLGLSTEDGSVYTKYDWIRVHDDVYYQVYPGLYVGMGFQFDRYADTRRDQGESELPSPYDEYSTHHGFDLKTQTAAGGSVNVLFDNRDSSIRPTMGWRAQGTYRRAFEDFFGGSSSWRRIEFDVRTYQGLGSPERRVLAFWLRGVVEASGATPYFELPGIGSDPYGRSGRGYAEGRYRGERLLAAEVEYRTTLTANGLLGAVVFANATTVSDLVDEERLFEFVAPGIGAGLRVLLNKRSKTNICVDFGVGRDGSTGFYVGVQEAF
jgi:hypothetical protein